ncbi:DNA double-strand break repair nuclease NurA [Merismopedia glauca]|uniref:Nuclease n=1 Tax=Merismopedia glauca CCAP 1448/3 TaxID=1296344 RepID=A0A2T1C2C8_9CYAN|nr:DNA double-strand break repair nuclease NurA [Merismopedia glauca]PSB02430.1 nuclease [Merismopedia glauca CCAP 1448/3]
MLDLTKLGKAMQGISQQLVLEAGANKLRLERAQKMLDQAQIHQDKLVKTHQDWRDRFIFTPAVPIEPLDTRIPLDIAPEKHTVIATDGSQISPSHHEIAYCYLINIGRVLLHYGQSLYPLLDSFPEVFSQPEDLYVSRQWGIRTEEWMGYRRTVSEAVALANLAIEWKNTDLKSHKPAVKQLSLLETNSSFVPHPLPPTLAMVDGSLLYWFLEPLPTDARDRILYPILEAWEQLRQAKIPLMGYLSSSRSTESLNFFRLPACTHPVPDCLKYCQELERTPCQLFDSLRDSVFWGMELQPGERSPLWRSSAAIQSFYGEHQIYFCYVHVGAEIARIEVPEWVVTDSALFDQALSLMLAQVQKGYGYPVALAEAHNQAVVRGGDRARFFALLEQQMIRSGVRNVGISYKEARKRGSIA